MSKDIAALVEKHIGSEFVNVERALDFVIRDFAARFTRFDTKYFREREQDIRDVGRRMAWHMADSPPRTSQPLSPGSVIVARELLPSETVELARSGVVATHVGVTRCAKPCVASTPNMREKLPTTRFAVGHQVKYDNCSLNCTPAKR